MTATAWKPPPARVSRANAEEQLDYRRLIEGYFELTGEVVIKVLGWRESDGENFELQLSDGSVYRVEGHTCCDKHPWKATKVERLP